MITKRDKKLIDEAINMPYTEWFEIDPTAAETKEAQDLLRKIAFRKYLEEEYTN